MKRLLELVAAFLRRQPGASLMPDLQDALVFGGIGCMCYGVAHYDPALAWILAGVLLFWLGVRSS